MKLNRNLSKPGIFCSLATALVMQGGALAPRALANTDSPQPTTTAELAQNQEPVVDQKAADLLRAMSDLLESAPGLSFTTKETRDILTSTGLPLQVSHIIEAVAQRPDKAELDASTTDKAAVALPPGKLWMNMTGDVVERTFWADGRTVTLFDRENNVFATLAVPGDLTETINTMIDTYNVDLPMAQLFMTGLYDFLTKEIKQGYYIGLSTVDVRPCHQILVVEEDIDWQIWIQDGAVPLPCKAVITYKKKPGTPTITEHFTHWNLNPVIPAKLFTAKCSRRDGKGRVSGESAVIKFEQSSTT